MTKATNTTDDERDLTDAEVEAWIKANKDRILKDLAEAEASLARGDGKEFDLAEFLAEVHAKYERRKGKKR
jgi:hypothetical protein